MTQPAYPAARAAAISVHPHYAQHLAARIAVDPGINLLRDVETIEAIIDVAFWEACGGKKTIRPEFL